MQLTFKNPESPTVVIVENTTEKMEVVKKIKNEVNASIFSLKRIDNQIEKTSFMPDYDENKGKQLGLVR